MAQGVRYDATLGRFVAAEITDPLSQLVIWPGAVEPGQFRRVVHVLEIEPMPRTPGWHQPVLTGRRFSYLRLPGWAGRLVRAWYGVR